MKGSECGVFEGQAEKQHSWDISDKGESDRK